MQSVHVENVVVNMAILVMDTTATKVKSSYSHHISMKEMTGNYIHFCIGSIGFMKQRKLNQEAQKYEVFSTVP